MVVPHPVHGVNPTVYQCFIRGEDVGLLLVGIQAARMFGTAKAPRTCGAINKEPCDKCKGYMEQGIILISVRTGETDTDNPHRTGGWVVLKEEALRRLVVNNELCDDICRKRVAFVPDDAWDAIGLPRGDVPPPDAPG